MSEAQEAVNQSRSLCYRCLHAQIVACEVPIHQEGTVIGPDGSRQVAPVVGQHHFLQPFCCARGKVPIGPQVVILECSDWEYEHKELRHDGVRTTEVVQ